ncbi:FecR family protein [Aquimarina sp. 2201CG14-23]|uniref:FecR family protein n=1 Tax=Aquimarina mycalae TaxID=3040073 RepID=UPI002477CBE4|nr:FecR family protein [Aquimarina sp. 2201CG14-23]MDH7444729.1 FecR family protein [Aquimarina sp. 2201CG14-23]
MKKEDIIKKWLNYEQLTKQESEAFEQLSAYDSYVKISDASKKFKAPNYNSSEHYQTLYKELVPQKTVPLKRSYLPNLVRIAAVFAIGIGLYFSFFKEYNTTYTTLASEKSTIELPDTSTAILNALSSIEYNKKNWPNQRSLTLTGEAFFKVADGKKFDVHTSSGIVSVLGTQFNIKQRGNYFEVTCYEGVVSVTTGNQVKYLKAGDVLELSSKIIKEKKINRQEPHWINDRSSFYSTPYSKVLKELEWQYGVTITTKNIDKTILFTGNFVHSDIQTALKSITIPMRLKYVINNKTVTLFKE